jgi:uncharacterized protein
MTQPAKSQEPSMEEILASIRRIIADDDASKMPPPEPEPPKSVPRPVAPQPRMSALERPESAANAASVAADPPSDILNLTESMEAPPAEPPPPAAPITARGPAPQFHRIDGQSDVGFDGVAERPSMQSTVDGARRQFAHANSEGELMSNVTSAAVDSAFNTLAQTVSVQNSRTLEDLVREMLRPLLKAWLDDNLPAMVERLVRAEIERVSRGRA